MAKRDNGAGAVTQRTRERSDGSVYKYWEGRVTVGTDANGNQKRRTVTAHTKTELLAKMKEISIAVERGTYAEVSKLTVLQWLNEWFDVYEKRKVKQYTANSYKTIIEKHIGPEIGNIKLQKLRNSDLQRFYNALADKGLSGKTIKNIDAVISKALGDALKHGVIGSNPRSLNVELPKVKQHEVSPLTDAEIPAFIAAIDNEPFRNVYALALFCGLRKGECLGLSWDNVDLKNKRITISQQLQRNMETGQYFVEKSTKSNRTRVILMPPLTVDYLKAEKRKQDLNRMAAGEMWSNPDNLVFTDEVGRRISFPTLNGQFKRMVTRMGRPDLRFHDLRHSAATVALAAGADIKSVQQLLGHSSASTTLNIYSHVTEKMKEDTASRIQSYYDGLGQKA